MYRKRDLHLEPRRVKKKKATKQIVGNNTWGMKKDGTEEENKFKYCSTEQKVVADGFWGPAFFESTYIKYRNSFKWSSK